MASEPARVNRPAPNSSSNRGKSRRGSPPPTGNRGFLYLLLGLAIVGIGVLWYLARQSKQTSIPANVEVLAADTAGFRGYVMGSDSAKVEITEFADYQCPVCQDFDVVQFPAVRKQLIETGLVRWRYRDFPLDEMHRYARLAAHSAACADEQGKFWEQHERIYATHPQWSTSSNAASVLREAAQSVGLDMDKYDSCMESAKYKGRIEASRQEGNKLGINSTPTFLINGRLYPGRLSSDSLRALANAAIAASAK